MFFETIKILAGDESFVLYSASTDYLDYHRRVVLDARFFKPCLICIRLKEI